MMSIAGHVTRAVAAAATTLPVPPVPTVATPPTPGLPPWMGAVLVVWAAVGAVAAWAAGTFERRGIVGPERLRTDESAWPLVSVLGGGVVAFSLSVILAGGLARAAAERLRPGPMSDLAGLAIGGLPDVAVAVTLLLMGRNLRPGGLGLRQIGLDPRRFGTGVAGGTATLFALLPLVYLTGAAIEWAAKWFHWKRPEAHPVLKLIGTDHSVAVAAAAVVLASVVAPLAEELVFRGVLQTTLGRLFGWALFQMGLAPMTVDAPGAAPDLPASRCDGPVPMAHASPDRRPYTPALARWSAVVVTSAAFAAVHQHEVGVFVPLFVLSVGLGYAYERSGNLWLNVVTHALFNGVQIALFLSIGG